MASARVSRTAPRGEFVCKHLRAVARGVARLCESHVSRAFLQAINECADALAVQLLARGAVVQQASSACGLLSQLLSIDYTPRANTRHTFVKVSIHPVEEG